MKRLAVFLLCVLPLAAFAETQPTSPKQYHDGSIRDISAIGNRNVGCGRGVANWYSLDKQVAMGKQFAQQVEAQAKLIKDPQITEYVNRIGQQLVRNSDAQVPFTIKVIDSDEVNAFALPGGFFYVNSGLILNADNEAELAGVMAHEIAHVAACHAAREQSRAQLANLASIPLIFIGGGIGYAIQEAAGIGVPLGFMKFSRNFESEADYLGIEYLYKAGYDPQAMSQMFEKLEALEKKKPNALEKAFSTHPQTPERVEKTQNEIASLLPPKDQYIEDTSEFQQVKSRLAELENRRKMEDNNPNRPTLRRASTADGGGSTTASNRGDGGPPVLRRRDGSSSGDDQQPTLNRAPASDSSSTQPSGASTTSPTTTSSTDRDSGPPVLHRRDQ